MNRVFLVLAAIILLAPLYFMAVGSFQDIQGVMLMPPRLWPYKPTLANYEFFLSFPMLKWIGNSAIVMVGTALLSVTVSCCAAYTFAFYEFRFKRVLWMMLLAGIMVPRIALIIPLFVVVYKIGLTGTLLGIILSRALAPASLYLARVYFETVPRSLLEVARIDGASEVQILRSIVAPISRPIITCLALFAAVGALSDFVWQALQLMRGEKRTLLVGLIRATAMNVMNAELQLNPLGRKFAMSMILMLPLLVIFFTASKYFTASLSGAIKE